MSKLYEMLEEPERGTLVYIPTHLIEPHPDNPRKNLGDLTELADSIRQNGILQNLTVVPQEDGRYRALIGHRRLAAAKLAGLTEVPCVIVEMSYRDQLQTMLQENMQRSDLTVYEQAQGFQMMLDLGETVESLAEKSGFSQSTIRRRVKLLELDEGAFKESVERGATLADYAELDKIESAERKNKVLAAIGTANFRSVLKSELAEEKKERNVAKARATLSAFATEVDDICRYQYRVLEYWYDGEVPDNLQRPEEEGPYYFCVASWGAVYLLADRQQQEETDAQRIQREKAEQAREREAKLREAWRRAADLRAEFAENVSLQTVKEHWADITATWICLGSMEEASEVSDDIAKKLSLPTEDYDEYHKWVRYEDCLAYARRQPERALWLLIWESFGDGHGNHYYHWSGRHQANKSLDVLYNLLCTLGYEMSTEEKQLQDGSHPMYLQEEE